MLRHGFKHRGLRFQACYFQPEPTLKQKDATHYAQNVIPYISQHFRSDTTHNLIDMVLTVNGIPVFAFEQKNQHFRQVIENTK